jgi:hypothetical protein
MIYLTGRIATWVRTRLGSAVLTDRKERAMRVLEEAAELAQAEGVTVCDASWLVERVFSRPKGEPSQEAAGVQVCLLAWAYAADERLDDLTRSEVERIEGIDADHFRRKQAEKAAAGVAMHPTVHAPKVA